MKLEGKAKMLRIHFGEDDKWNEKPLYRAIVENAESWILPAPRSSAGLKDTAPAR